MSLDPKGYIDFAYILPEARGMGIFRGLYLHIEKRARDNDLGRLSTHASLMAEPAFAAMGFEVVQRETVEIGGVELSRFAMEKFLA